MQRAPVMNPASSEDSAATRLGRIPDEGLSMLNAVVPQTSAHVKLQRGSRAAWSQARNLKQLNRMQLQLLTFCTQILDAHVHERSLSNVVSSERITDAAAAMVTASYSYNHKPVIIALRWIVVSTLIALLQRGAAAWKQRSRRL